MVRRTLACLEEQRGVVLILSIFVLLLLTTLGLAFLTTAATENTIAVNYRNHVQAFYAAEAGVESGVVSLKSLVGANPTPTDAQLAGLLPPALTDPNYTFNAFQVQRVRTVAPYSYQTTLTTGAYAGLMAWTTDYEVTATVTGPRGSQARVTQKLQHVGIPLFQFMGFYGRGVDLELSPGPAMTITGRIHSNSNLYLKAGDGGLKIDSYATTTGDIYRYVKGYPDRGKNPQIKDANGVYQTLNFDHEYNYDFASKWSESDWTSAALKAFGGRVQDSSMSVQEILPPIPDTLYDPKNADKSSHLMIEKGSVSDSPALKDAKIYYQADLRIEDGQGHAKDGSTVNLNKCKKGGGGDAVETKTFWDGREKKMMTVTEVDVGVLDACGVMPANGILYVSRGDADGAVRLVNGSKLPSQGLTVVSGNPVYIQGDYNTVNKVPASVLGDAITVLSNNWEKNGYDKKGKDVTSSRKAAATTVNAAFATGPSHESVMDKSNGQMNNLIRFLEHWTSVDFTYNGSLVALWHSQQAKEWFRCCGDGGDLYYTPPNRIWSYETLFNTNQPPGTPMGTIYLRGQWTEG
ncbi:MAG: PilX N-terminal domain-containing pilus assembly protein [candidate division NC10 bacterium]|nr:PilX N-terminal domain-containing pilus assembly protein [candidate division NC10 bacterium]